MKNYLLIIETEQSEGKPDQSNNAVELKWRHNDRDGVSNHQPHDCLLNGLFRRKSTKTSELRITGFVKGIHRWPVNSPQQEPVTRKKFSFDDVIMISADKKMIGAFVIDYIHHESWVEINFHFVATWHCMFNWSRKLITLCSTLCQLIAYMINYTQIHIYWMGSQIQTTSFREYAIELYGKIRLYVTTESLNVTKLLDIQYIWNRRKRNSNTNIFV